MFWVIMAAVAVLFAKYYTAVGSRKLHRRISNVKSDLSQARKRLKEVREEEYATSRNEEDVIQRVRVTKEMIDDLQLRLTLSEESKEPVVVENNKATVALPF